MKKLILFSLLLSSSISFIAATPIDTWEKMKERLMRTFEGAKALKVSFKELVTNESGVLEIFAGIDSEEALRDKHHAECALDSKSQECSNTCLLLSLANFQEQD